MNSGVTTEQDATIDPGEKSTSAWKAYELDVHAFVKTLDKHGHATWNTHRPGLVSGIGRQIDVLVETALAGSTASIVIECKAYKNPVDVGKVDELVGKLLDLGVGEGHLYALHGVTSAARSRAENSVLPRIKIMDLTVMKVDSSGVVIEPERVAEALEALGWVDCPAEGCFGGEVGLTAWPPRGTAAGFCDSCGTLSVECETCETMLTAEVGTNICHVCDAVYEVGHDGDGKPVDVELVRSGTVE